MKKIIYLLSLVTVFILGSCSDDLPKASWDICQVGTLNATAQDEKVLLEWAPMQGANPTGYLVNWTPEVATYEGGSVELDAKTTSYTITGLVNKVTYTITIQAIYGNQRSMISTTKARPVSDTEPFKVWSTDMPNGGMVKTANAVFSLDGNTFYLPSAGATGDVTAFDAMTGAVKWTAAIPKTTYGGGVAVGKDGTLYQGARNATLYAINSDGSQKWTYATGAANKNLDCFPAVTADGQTVYVLDGDNVLHSINTATGAKNWNVKLTGTKNKAGAESFKKIYDQLSEGNPIAVYDKELLNSDGTPAWHAFEQNVGNNYIVGDILSDLRKIENMFNTAVGIPNANTDKKERLIQSEVESNNTETATLCELWLDELKKSVEKTNKMFNLSITVNWRKEPGGDDIERNNVNNGAL